MFYKLMQKLAVDAQKLLEIYNKEFLPYAKETDNMFSDHIKAIDEELAKNPWVLKKKYLEAQKSFLKEKGKLFNNASTRVIQQGKNLTPVYHYNFKENPQAPLDNVLEGGKPKFSHKESLVSNAVIGMHEIKEFKELKRLSKKPQSNINKLMETTANIPQKNLDYAPDKTTIIRGNEVVPTQAKAKVFNKPELKITSHVTPRVPLNDLRIANSLDQQYEKVKDDIYRYRKRDIKEIKKRTGIDPTKIKLNRRVIRGIEEIFAKSYKPQYPKISWFGEKLAPLGTWLIKKKFYK